MVFKPERCEIESPDGTIIPINERNGLYFLEGERTHTTTHEYHGLNAHLVACSRERERQDELAFLSNVDLDEAIFDFEQEKSKELKGTQSDAKESASRRTRSFQTAVKEVQAQRT